ncbi:hypothetical protein D3C83_137550 [compost metagenome]
MLPILKPAHDLIAADVKSDTRKLYDFAGFQSGVAPANNPLKAFLDARRAYLLNAASTPRAAVR